jgi:hypothetical protein
VWAGSLGSLIAFFCYLLSLFKRAPLPFLWMLGIAGGASLVFMLLDAGPGRQSLFARCVQYGFALAVLSFSDHARDQAGLTFAIVGSLIYGIVAALAFRFYVYDPREKISSTKSAGPLH